MTLIAIISNPTSAPFIVSDVLISGQQQPAGRMLGPSGPIVSYDKKSGYYPENLEQKMIIIGSHLCMAYAGASIIGKSISKKFMETFCNTTPKKDLLSNILSEYDSELEQFDTSIIVAFIDENNEFDYITYGDGFVSKEFSDGTKIKSVGTGSELLIEHFDVVCNSPVGGCPPVAGTLHRVLSILSEFVAWDCYSGEYRLHTGGLIEIASLSDNRLEKLPSALLGTILYKFNNGTAHAIGEAYLDFCYYDDILVFRRFGDIRLNEAKEIAGSDYLIGTIRGVRTSDYHERTDAAVRKIVAKLHQTSAIQIFSLIDVENPASRKILFEREDWNNFRIWRSESSFKVWKSKKLQNKFSNLLGVTKLYNL